MKTSSIVEIQDFRGFSPEAFRFLRSLKRNNRRNWFQPRKETYDELLRLPMMALICEIGEEARKFAPEIRFDPKHAVLRVYRDTRFSKDKTPYKTNIAASLPFGTYGKNMDSPGLYLHIEPGEIFVGGGLYMPNSQQLRKIREAIVQHSDSFLEIIEDRNFKKHFGDISGERLKTNPRGISPDHEMIDYLRLKQFFVSKTFDDSIALKKDFPKKVAKEFELMMPLLRWLNKSQSLW
ncbi:DUF2461 domain-containing protein [Bdellovibrio svalbardensis]|uniref:DUF2461 domain-containing protein n=1 Tax=Bdellovibrio svalbardensis TaxID=2972972 RepID=A0ABT6DDE5_9BACT|nr:DUF2461 domain-containing protein [Bdellovibrio svalbardensis]MDG0814859.1 DUF2461 domain-containing protein [Bdellovibrio svalbardensis]